MTGLLVGPMLWSEYRPVIKIGPKGALGSHEIRPIHSAPSLGQSILFQHYPSQRLALRQASSGKGHLSLDHILALRAHATAVFRRWATLFSWSDFGQLRFVFFCILLLNFQNICTPSTPPGITGDGENIA